MLRIAAVLALALAFFGKAAAMLQTIPTFVLGGISLVLFWMIAKTGLEAVAEVAMKMDWFSWLIVALMLTVGIGGEAAKEIFNLDLALQYGGFQMKGIGLAALIGITLNILWNLKGKEKK